MKRSFISNGVSSAVAVVVALVVATLVVSCRPTPPPGKSIYIPKRLSSFDWRSDTGQYSFARMAYTDDIAVFWEKGFGDDLSVAPDLEGEPMTVNLSRILEKTQSFYDYFKDTLEFIKKGSKADTFRMMVMLNYSLEGTAYGGDYDSKIGALWVTPNRLQDKKLNCIAHELGHSFQAQLVIDNDMRPSMGAIYEMTSQWMLWQVNPEWMTDENYHWVDMMKQTHLAFLHFDNIYHSPYVLEYWSEKHGKKFMADLWRSFTPDEDVVATYKRINELSQEDFNAEMFDAAQRFITYDMPRIREYAKPYANKHTCILDLTPKGWYQINEKRIPQNYGYNGIELSVPEPGESLTVEFEGLVKEVPEEYRETAGWRYGFVGVPEEGSPIYGEMASDPTGSITFTAPEGEPLSHLWLVVMGAPSEHKIEVFHRPDPNDLPFDPSDLPFDPNDPSFDPSNLPFDPDDLPFDLNELLSGMGGPSDEEVAPSAGEPQDQQPFPRRRDRGPVAQYPYRIKITGGEPLCEVHR